MDKINVNSFASVALRAKMAAKADVTKDEVKIGSRNSKIDAVHNARIQAFVQQPQNLINKKFQAMLRRKARIAKGRVGGVADLTEGHHKAMEEISRRYDYERKLGPVSRFGDGDGSWWDRWLAAPAPKSSSFESGYAVPQSGFKQNRPERHFVGITKQQDGDKIGVRVEPLRSWRAAAGLEEVESKEAVALRERRELEAEREKEAEKSDEAELRSKEMVERGKRVLYFQTESVKRKADKFEEMVKRSTDRLLKASVGE